MDELQMIVVRDRQRAYRAEASEHRLTWTAIRPQSEPAVGEISLLADRPGRAASRRLEGAIFGRETTAVASDCCVVVAERAG